MKKIQQRHPETAKLIQDVSARTMYSTAFWGKMVNGREELRLMFVCERDYYQRSRWTKAKFALYIAGRALDGAWRALRGK